MTVLHDRPGAPPLADRHLDDQRRFADFVDTHVVPRADRMHRQQQMPPDLVRRLADEGMLGASVPEKFGGGGCDALTLGLLAGELGRGCSSVRSLLTVHSMVCHVLARWGTHEQRQTWLPDLAAGNSLAALALSEPGAGSDASAISTTIERDGCELVVSGRKTWITYGQLADVYLVFGQSPDGPVAALVERRREGVSTTPINDLIGIRASMTAQVDFDKVRVPEAHLVGRWGTALMQVAGTALDLGRYTVAWGCVGIIDACLRACVDYTSSRVQFGQAIAGHQLVRQKLSDMATDHHTMRLLCLDAGRLRVRRDPSAFHITSIAKYASARAATRVAADAVQLHGANGCSSGYPVQRYRGDSAVMEIIEGSTQMHQVGLADHAFEQLAATQRGEGIV